jgi:acyl phosphate:glycerol-3-phosphate acyltransferase
MGPRLVTAAVVGYLAGTIPSADLVARTASGGSIDLRTSGSGNPGGANAARLLGKRWGYAVMASDIAKGALACAAGRGIGGDLGAHIAGTSAVIGHCYPVWSGFRGGKGVAAGVGQCLATFPAYLPIDLAVAATSSSSPALKNRALAATAAASVGWVAGGIVWWRRGWPNWWGPRPTAALPIAAAASSAVILYRFATARAPTQ